MLIGRNFSRLLRQTSTRNVLRRPDRSGRVLGEQRPGSRRRRTSRARPGRHRRRSAAPVRETQRHQLGRPIHRSRVAEHQHRGRQPDHGATAVFRYDRQTQTGELVSTIIPTNGVSGDASMSADGQLIASAAQGRDRSLTIHATMALRCGTRRRGRLSASALIILAPTSRAAAPTRA